MATKIQVIQPRDLGVGIKKNDATKKFDVDLPSLVDGSTINVKNGKLTANIPDTSGNDYDLSVDGNHGKDALVFKESDFAVTHKGSTAEIALRNQANTEWIDITGLTRRGYKGSTSLTTLEGVDALPVTEGIYYFYNSGAAKGLPDLPTSTLTGARKAKETEDQMAYVGKHVVYPNGSSWTTLTAVLNNVSFERKSSRMINANGVRQAMDFGCWVQTAFSNLQAPLNAYSIDTISFKTRERNANCNTSGEKVAILDLNLNGLAFHNDLKNEHLGYFDWSGRNFISKVGAENANGVDALQASATASTSFVNVFVDNVNGSDSNPGTYEKPFKTMEFLANVGAFQSSVVNLKATGKPYQIPASSGSMVTYGATRIIQTYTDKSYRDLKALKEQPASKSAEYRAAMPEKAIIHGVNTLKDGLILGSWFTVNNGATMVFENIEFDISEQSTDAQLLAKSKETSARNNIIECFPNSTVLMNNCKFTYKSPKTDILPFWLVGGHYGGKNVQFNGCVVDSTVVGKAKLVRAFTGDTIASNNPGNDNLGKTIHTNHIATLPTIDKNGGKFYVGVNTNFPIVE